MADGMNNMSRQFDALDLLAVVGFYIGVLNYTENVDQTTMQESINDAVKKLQEHLQTQDDKIDCICKKLGIEVNNEKHSV